MVIWIPQTPIHQGLRVFRHFQGPHQNWVLVNRAAHGIIYQSRFPDPQDPRKTCGWHLYQQFMKDPKGELDTSCKSEVEPFDFVGNPGLAQAFFGTNDIYENTYDPKPAYTEEQLEQIRTEALKTLHIDPSTWYKLQ